MINVISLDEYQSGVCGFPAGSDEETSSLAVGVAVLGSCREVRGEIKTIFVADVAERLLEVGEEEAGGGITLVPRVVVGIEVTLGLRLADLATLSLSLDPGDEVDQVTTELALERSHTLQIQHYFGSLDGFVYV